MHQDHDTPLREDPERIREKLAQLREELTAQEYAIVSARLLDQLKQPTRRPRYAVT